MTNFTDLAGLAGVAGATAASVTLLPGIVRLTKLHPALLPGALIVLMLIPFSGFPLAAYVRGATGDLSITTLVLVWCALTRPWFGCGAENTGNRRALLMLVAPAALVLYPLALGLTAFDTYRPGYGEPLFVVALLLVALAAWIWKYDLIALCIALATLAWAIGWYESDNLWDYLLDPFVSIYALAAVMLQTVKALLRRSRAHQSQPKLPAA